MFICFLIAGRVLYSELLPFPGFVLPTPVLIKKTIVLTVIDIYVVKFCHLNLKSQFSVIIQAEITFICPTVSLPELAA